MILNTFEEPRNNREKIKVSDIKVAIVEGDRRRYDVAWLAENINNTGLTRSARFEKIETIARRTFRLDDVPPSQGRELVLQSRIQSGRRTTKVGARSGRASTEGPVHLLLADAMF